MFCQRRSEFFYLLCVCVFVCVGGGGQCKNAQKMRF